MICGPRVDVYVGPEAKPYSLPKNLLCHYSEFFEKCFHGTFIEGQTQKLTLPEDRVEDFDLLLEYMLHGKITNKVSIKNTDAEGLDECVRFIEYFDKYNLSEAAVVIIEPLQQIIKPGYAQAKVSVAIEPSHIERVFQATTSGSILRSLFTQAALSYKGLQGSGAYQKQVDQIPEFAAEMLRQIRTCLPKNAQWTDPITHSVRKN